MENPDRLRICYLELFSLYDYTNKYTYNTVDRLKYNLENILIFYLIELGPECIKQIWLLLITLFA